MNAPRCWQLRDDACSNVETSVNTLCFSYPYGAMIKPMLGIRSQYPTAVQDGAESFRALTGWGADHFF